MTKIELITEEYYKDPGFNRRELSKKLNVRESYIRRVIRKLKKSTIEQGHKPLEEKIEFNNTSNTSAKLELESLTITTLEQSLEVANVDLTKWKVERYTIGSWQVTLKSKTDSGRIDSKGDPILIDVPKTVTMYKIQVWLRRLENTEWIDAIRNLITQIPKIKTPKKNFTLDGEYLLEVSLMDVHFGMLAWGKETGTDYDLEIAENLFLFAVQDLLERTKGYKPSRLLFPIGNDLFHINDHTNQTPQNRNPLDVDSRLIKIYEKAQLAVIKAINYCREVAPVDVIWVAGNHDPFLSYYLCNSLDFIFANDNDVTVDRSPKYRKYYPWGNSLIAYTHGVSEPLRDLPSIIATEEPQLWGNSKYREIHIGHKHKKMQMHWVNVDTMPGTVIRMIPSISGVDAWHSEHGYIKGYYAAESYLWDKENGVIGQFTSYVNHKK